MRREFDPALAGKFFHRESTRLFTGEQDREDFVQQCWAILLERDAPSNLRLIARFAARKFLSDQRGARKSRRMESGLSSVNRPDIVSDGFDGSTLYLVPANPNDRRSMEMKKVKINGRVTRWNLSDLSEALFLSEKTLLTYKSKKTSITVFLHEGRVFPSVRAMAAALKKRASSCSAIANRVQIDWID